MMSLDVRVFGMDRVTVRRWLRNGVERVTPYGTYVGYYEENGFKAYQRVAVGGGFQTTRWRFDGSLFLQISESQFVDVGAPFLYGNGTDQTEPTAPWWNKE